MTAALPTLFISHGSPMHALEPGAVRGAWEKIARELPRPKALLIASAHWETVAPAMTASAKPETIHDFYGFPRPLYQIQYPVKGDPGLASRAVKLLKEKNLEAASDPSRGLDHGAWSPLLYMYPQAEVPVVQIAVQTALGPRHELAVGQALAPLADEGVLIIGSGHTTHNLRERRAGAALPYVVEFQDWVWKMIQARDLDMLAEYRARNPHGARAHPTEEHFLPLFVALGAASAGYRPERVFDGVDTGSLAMDAYVFH